MEKRTSSICSIDGQLYLVRRKESVMTKEAYIKLTEPLRKHPGKTKMVIYINKILTGLVYLVYPSFLLLLYWEKNPFLLQAVLVPAISFVGVTLFRK